MASDSMRLNKLNSNDANIAAPSKLSLIKLALPTIVGNLLLSVVALIAIGFVDKLGPEYVSAVVAADRIYFVIQAIIFGLSVGTTALVANAFGAKSFAEADRSLKISLIVGIGLALVIALLVELSADWLLSVTLSMSDQARGLAAQYLKILTYFNLFFAYVAITSAALRAAGDVITPVIMGVLGNIVTVFFTYALVFGRFGFPNLGLMGAAYAVGVALCVESVVLHVLWLNKKLILQPVKQTIFAPGKLAHLIRLSIPSCIEQLILQFVIVGFMSVVSLYSEAAYTAYGIGINILSLSIVIGFGFSVATSTIVGQHLGAHQPDEAEQSAWHSMRWAVGTMFVIALILGLGARAIASTLISDPQTINYLVALVFVLASVQPLMAVEFALSGALRGAGDTKTTAIITGAGFLFGRILFTAIFYFLDLSVYWIYGALMTDYLVKLVLYVIVFKKGRWKTAFEDSKQRSEKNRN